MPPDDTHDTPASAPRSPADLFFSFNSMALQGFGGVLAIAQRELVERKGWMTREQFVETLAVSQVLPGPNIVNLSLMVGDRHFGLRGAVAALAGMIAVPLVIVLVLAALYAEFASVPMVAGALRGMGAVAAGLVIATGLKLLGTLRKNPLGVPIGAAFAAAMFAGVAVLHWPLVWMLLGLGVVSCALAWSRL
jgi:chromate transporter